MWDLDPRYYPAPIMVGICRLQSIVALPSPHDFCGSFHLRAKVPDILPCACYCSRGATHRIDMVHRCALELGSARPQSHGRDSWGIAHPTARGHELA